MITVTSMFGGNYLSLKSNYAYKGRLSRLPGARWNPDIRTWVIPRNSLQALINEFQGELYFKTPLWKILGQPEPPKEEIRYFFPKEAAPEMFLTPYDYQKDGIAFMIDRINRYGFALCADGVGLGKTLESIGTIKYFKETANVKRVVIVCKKSIKHQWKKEIVKIAGIDENCIFVTGDTKAKRKKAYEGAMALDEFVLITNYNNFLGDFNELASMNFDFAVIDEVHCLKNRNGKMNQAIGEITRGVKTILLTGTPIMSKPDDIYGIIKLVKPLYFGDYEEFKERYMVEDYTPFGMQIIGARNLDELRERIQSFMIRRTKDDVHMELPEVIESEEHVLPDKTQTRLFELIAKQSSSFAQKIEQMVDANGNPLKPEYISEINDLRDREKGLRAAKQFAADDPRCFLKLKDSPMNKSLKEAIPENYKRSPKTEATLDKIEEIINAEGKVIVFTHFRTSAVLLAEEIKDNLKANVLMYTGVESEEIRDQNINLFWNSEEHNILIGTEAMAEGLNLQCANYIINYEQADTYAQKNQRTGRIQRIGSQYSHASVYDMITDTSLDEIKMNKIEKDKQLSAALVT